jgi:hypothetical protein
VSTRISSGKKRRSIVNVSHRNMSNRMSLNTSKETRYFLDLELIYSRIYQPDIVKKKLRNRLWSAKPSSFQNNYSIFKCDILKPNILGIY